MNEDKFWEIIQRVHDKSSKDMDAKSESIKNEIEKLSDDETRQFSIIFDSMMDKAYSWNLWGAAYIINGGCSDDSFTDFRSSLISRGKIAFETALSNPDSLADQEYDEDLWFYEGYQYAITDGLEAVLGEIPNRVTPYPEIPAGDEWSEEELENLYPKLSAMFGEEWGDEKLDQLHSSPSAKFAEKIDDDFISIAEHIINTIQSNFLEEHEFLPATLSSFEELDKNFYATTQKYMEEIGFTYIADLENRNISKQGIQTCIRTMHHPETKAMAAFFYVPSLQIGFLELESVLTNNSFIVNTTTPKSNAITTFPTINMEYHPVDISASQLYSAHLEHVMKILSVNKNTKCISITSYDDIVKTQNLMNKIKHDKLASIGWVTLEYLKNQTHGDEEFAAKIYEAAQQILKD